MSANQADGHRLHEVSSDGKNLSELFFLERRQFMCCMWQ